MQYNGPMYFSLDSSENPRIGFERQLTYKERHKDDPCCKNFIHRLWDNYSPALIIGIIFLILFQVIFAIGFIPSESMMPTLHIGDIVLANRMAYDEDNVPLRGDVVIFKSEEYGAILIKRVIGQAGDVVDLRNGNVFINGCLLKESYAWQETYPAPDGDAHYVVPEGCVFLLGDNRSNSADSRYWEDPYMPYDNILGKAFFFTHISVENLEFKFQHLKSLQPEFYAADENYMFSK